MKKISLECLLEESGAESYPEQYRYICSRILGAVSASPLCKKKRLR